MKIEALCTKCLEADRWDRAYASHTHKPHRNSPLTRSESFPIDDLDSIHIQGDLKCAVTNEPLQVDQLHTGRRLSSPARMMATISTRVPALLRPHISTTFTNNSFSDEEDEK